MFDEHSRRRIDLDVDGLPETELTGVAVFIVAYAYLLRKIRIDQMFAFGDLPPYYGARALAKFGSVYHPHQLGYTHIFNAVPAYLGAATYVGGEVAQNLIFLALIPAGFCTFLVFAGRYVTGVPRLLGAGVYALNPITINEFVNGGVGALLAFAGVPLVLHYLYRTAEQDDWFDAVKTGAAFGAFAVIPYLVFWMVAPFAVYLLATNRDRPSVAPKLFAGGAIGVLLALPSVHYIFQRANALGSQDVLFNHVEWNYASAAPLKVLRLAGNHGAYAMNHLGYNSESMMVVGLVIPAVAAFAWPRREIRYLYVVVAVPLVFMVLTKYAVTYPLFEVFPPLFSLRNPVKLQYPMLIATSLLFAVGVEELFDGLDVPRRRTAVQLVVLAILLVPLAAYVAPASGALGLQELRGDGYTIPDEYETVGERVEGRTLWAPYSYTTQLRLRHAYPNHVGIRSGGLVQGKANGQLVTELFRDIGAGERVHARLSELGVQYIVVDGTPQRRYPAGDGQPRLAMRHEAPWLFGSPETFTERFDAASGYEEAFTVGDLTVFEVVGAPDRDGRTSHEGLHAVVAPENATVERVGENRLSNPTFDGGLDGWWTPPNVTGRETRLVEDGDGTAVELTVNDEAKPLPLAQSLDVRPRHPYEVTVDATGEGVLNLVWFDGANSADNRVDAQTVPLDDGPVSVRAKSDTLAVRVVPNATGTVRVRSVGIYRTTYPPETGAAAGEAIPGVTVDGRDDPPAAATVVAANLPRDAPAAADASVRVVDAETVVAGDLVFRDSFRQGVAVRLDRGERPARIPANARAVTHETDAGRVVDYWVIGTFGDTPVSAVWTSYHDGWSGPDESTHVRAAGWANGFTNADPGDVRWTGGGERTLVVRVWLVAWAIVLGSLLAPIAYGAIERWRKRRRRQQYYKL